MSKLTSGLRLNSNQLCDDIPSEVAALSTQVTGDWLVTTGNDLGTPCCKYLLHVTFIVTNLTRIMRGPQVRLSHPLTLAVRLQRRL